MPDFVADATSLAGPKTDGAPPTAGYLYASEYNALRQAVLDLRTHVVAQLGSTGAGDTLGSQGQPARVVALQGKALDASVGTPNDGDVVVYDAALGKWKAAASGAGVSLLETYNTQTTFATTGAGAGQQVNILALPAGINGDSAIVEARVSAGSTVAATMRGWAAAVSLIYNGNWQLDDLEIIADLGASVASFSIDLSAGPSVRLLIDDGGQIHRVNGCLGIRIAQ